MDNHINCHILLPQDPTLSFQVSVVICPGLFTEIKCHNFHRNGHVTDERMSRLMS